MRDAETILAIIRERGTRGLPLERLYRALFNPALYLVAYGKIYRNAGALTPGATPETVDGMALERIRAIIGALRQERYRWTPARRVYIEKKRSTQKRPLGIPVWSDKLLQEVLRLLLEAYYEPQFSAHSHGFRPGRGCHTALAAIQRTWRGTTWFIEGDIRGCFDHIDHGRLLDILRERVHDGRIIRLLAGLLDAGYLEEWRYHRTLSGTPQGGVLSPLLANIYLDRLDGFVERVLLPAYTRGTARRKWPEYQRRIGRAEGLRKRGDREGADGLLREAQAFPSRDPRDPGYRRLRYVRYADDFLLGFAGPKREAEEIKRRIGEFLRDQLALELSEGKTLVTHARSQRARFLGYDLGTLHDDRKHTNGKRSINSGVEFRVPREVVVAKCRAYQRGGIPTHRLERTQDTVYSTLMRYQAEYRGLVQYYQLAHNLTAFARLKWVMEQSLAKTLAHKLRISVSRVYRRYQVTVDTPDGPRKVLREVVAREGKPPLVARWGAVSLRRHTTVGPLNDAPAPVWSGRAEVVKRLLADTCELCGSHEAVQVHHIRHLKTLRAKGRRERPAWVLLMAARRRKTLVVCRACHVAIHAGRPAAGALTDAAPESRMR